MASPTEPTPAQHAPAGSPAEQLCLEAAQTIIPEEFSCGLGRSARSKSFCQRERLKTGGTEQTPLRIKVLTVRRQSTPQKVALAKAVARQEKGRRTGSVALREIGVMAI